MVSAALLATAAPAWAAPGISVSKSTGLDPAGDTITVSGSGFDVTKGIYVAVCVDNGPGQVPTPCLGGADTSGGAGGSKWISSNPPSYGQGLATPYGPGGTFTVTLSVVAVDPVTGTDCTKVRCAAVTRADHTRTSDRSQDARVPLAFGLPPAPRTTTTTTAAPPPPPPPTTTTPTTTTTTTTTSATTTTTTSTTAPAVENTAAPTSPSRTGWWLGGAAAVLLAAVVVLVLRRRRRTR
ncbi:neocarzinostatin family protein [Actinophytocola oryzae]|uniref:Neocarzinostatin family protein n=2 Tax=Actinophytocola oryzae TaxID=502181 RepID=A0A4R7UU37_9PSEU|nr:neocarzinostatin family protein [Actinophytocola oryzae]